MRVIYHHRTQGRDVEAVHIRGLAGGLEQLGYRVRIVGPPGVRVDPDSPCGPKRRGRLSGLWSWAARSMPQLGFELLEIGYNSAALPRLLRACRNDRPALIYERYALFNAAGVIAGRLTGVPVILEVNETARVDRTRQGKRMALPAVARWLERRIFAGASGLVVVSSYLRDQLVELGVPEERIRVVPNAVDPCRFDPETIPGEPVRRRHGLAGKTVVGFTGSFAKWHGVDLLIRACGSLAAELPDLALLLVGDGPQRPTAEALARDLGVADRVVFAGKVPHAEIPGYVAAMDVGVMPASNVHGSPMKVFEYMAMARPPVAPRYGPLEEAIDHGRTGLLFEPESLEGLTASLRELAADPQRRKSLGEAARRRVTERHLWVHNARIVLDLARGSSPRPVRSRPGVRPDPEAAPRT